MFGMLAGQFLLDAFQGVIEGKRGPEQDSKRSFESANLLVIEPGPAQPDDIHSLRLDPKTGIEEIRGRIDIDA